MKGSCVREKGTTGASFHTGMSRGPAGLGSCTVPAPFPCHVDSVDARCEQSGRVRGGGGCLGRTTGATARDADGHTPLPWTLGTQTATYLMPWAYRVNKVQPWPASQLSSGRLTETSSDLCAGSRRAQIQHCRKVPAAGNGTRQQGLWAPSRSMSVPCLPPAQSRAAADSTCKD